MNKLDEILRKIKKNEINCFLSGENDALDIYLEIHAGAGGTESQDWAEMLRRMYLKWFDKKSFKYEVISEHRGEEAGIKSSTLKVTGEYLYGLMKKRREFIDWLEFPLLIVELEGTLVLQVYGFILP